MMHGQKNIKKCCFYCSETACQSDLRKNIEAVWEDVVRRMCVLKTRGNRRMKKLRDEEIQNLYSMLNIIKGNKIPIDEVDEVRNMHGKEYKHI